MVHVLKLDTPSLKKKTVFYPSKLNPSVFRDSYVFVLLDPLGKCLLHKHADFQKVTKYLMYYFVHKTRYLHGKYHTSSKIWFIFMI